ncbi:stalk domain-containing protein [Saccharibacillus brassicae]|uniref:Copper amine oxidase-like N-terminal domain-containing protein n=1 Tax=Saccharibacillus brassicae TaxID=2583377 RepID=A0A4Y6UWK4_SACBS|nr:stalk domain-containing protein [Saccharibacillus brassicae]QDH20796.1 hypothetical protein FFV09_08035 [Saccharibacillus brassicae]
MRLAKKSIALWFVLLLMIGTSVPAFAAETVTLTLQVRLGSTKALVNGSEQKIEKPYTQNGMVMVPLGVFQRAFGTTSRLEGDNVVRVSYGARVATFTIGSKTVWTNGTKKVWAAAPVMKNGTLMVPLRPVADLMGAGVKTNAGTVTVTLKSDNGIPGQPVKPGEDAEEITGRVGSSYAGWSIDSPAGSMAELGDDEYSAAIGDADGTYMLQIHVWDEEAGTSVPVSDLLEQLEQEALDSGETIVDRRTVPNAGRPYARLISRDLDGIYWEARRYDDKGRIYSLYLGDSLIEDYRAFEDRAPLLDSFRTSFATSGMQTKDLSAVVDGQMNVSAPDYGVSMKIPAEWSPAASGLFQYGGEDGSVLAMQVISAEPGETLDGWHNLLKQRTGELFLPEYLNPIVSESLTVSGQDARIEKMTYNLGSGSVYWNWLVLRGKEHFYVLRYSAPEGAYREQTLRRIADSVEVDFSVVEDSFGKLGQIPYLKDKTLNISKSTPEMKISVPAYWTPQAMADSEFDLGYFLPGGSFELTDVEEGPEAAVAQAVRRYADWKLDDATLKHEAPQRTEFAGVPAVRIAYTGTDGNAYRAEDIYFRHGGTTYWIHYRIDLGMATQPQLDGIERALRSVKFLKSSITGS